MPEGHTIHRLARDHSRWLAGNTLTVTSPQGRFADGASALNGRRMRRTEAHGKHLFYVFDGDEGELWVHIHLGLFGKFKMFRAPAPAPRDTVRMRLATADRVVQLTGPTACEVLDHHDVQRLRDRLGDDPLRDDADPERVWARFQRTRRAIGAVLLDQSIIAGVGNVYRAELLFLIGVWPELPARDLPRAAFDDLWARTVRLLQLGVKTNRIITTDPAEFGKPPSRLNRGERLWVYKRKTCRRCDTPVQSLKLANRTIYACPLCQERSP